MQAVQKNNLVVGVWQFRPTVSEEKMIRIAEELVREAAAKSSGKYLPPLHVGRGRMCNQIHFTFQPAPAKDQPVPVDPAKDLSARGWTEKTRVHLAALYRADFLGGVNGDHAVIELVETQAASS